MTPLVTLSDWGTRPYGESLSAQRDLVAQRIRGDCGDTLVFVEHPAVFTLGRQGGRANILVSDDVLRAHHIDVVEVERGGDITYHGPGQLVAYPIFRLPEGRRDIKSFMRALEQAVVRTCGDFGVSAKPIEGLAGVWVGERKICSMGPRLPLLDKLPRPRPERELRPHAVHLHAPVRIERRAGNFAGAGTRNINRHGRGQAVACPAYP